MKVYKFTAVFKPEKDTRFSDYYTVFVPALPGCFSFGGSLAEAHYNIREAIELYLESLVDDNAPIPKDRKVRLPREVRSEEITVGIDYQVRAGFEQLIRPVNVAR
ncbi:MAG: type II toxin-antitoxin system HicB family antitoxin [Candidatus Vogelbacteria bacterium]|nr:type II toxin-antitoxin system HicB family antitoxin [Candidatus Vogelbacteria bacterium]